MKIITLFYIFLYLSHITFGPYYYWYLFKNEPAKWKSKTFGEVIKRSMWITYVGFILIAFFNEYPNSETFILALVISLLSSLGYLYKFQSSEEYMKGFVDHFLIMILPLYLLFYKYNINLLKYKPTVLTLLVIIYIIFFKYYDNILYDNSGIDI